MIEKWNFLRYIRVILGTPLSLGIAFWIYAGSMAHQSRLPLDTIEQFIFGIGFLVLMVLQYLALQIIGAPSIAILDSAKRSLISRLNRPALRNCLRPNWLNLSIVILYIGITLACSWGNLNASESDPKGAVVLMQIPIAFQLEAIQEWNIWVYLDHTSTWWQVYLQLVPPFAILLYAAASLFKYMTTTLSLFLFWMFGILMDAVLIRK